jgi:predicted transglutaminase-like protease
MSFKKINRDKKSAKKYENACSWGYCPSLAERKNDRIIELANRLKADSEKETLANIAEWQNNNVLYWFERSYLSPALWVLVPLSLGSLLGLLIQLWRSPATFPTIFSPSIIMIVLVLGTVTVTLKAMTIFIIVYYRKMPLKYLYNVFSFSNPIDFLVEKRLAVCRDYAKLSACILFSIYPEREIYFVHAPSHVVTGIMVGENLYILDKYLPVATFDKWHKLWHRRRLALARDKKVERAEDIYMESVSLTSVLPKTNSSGLDKDRLASELERLLNIQRLKVRSEKSPILILHWKKGAVLYEDDEIVNYSIAQRLKKMLSNGKLDVNQLANIRIDLDKDDLIFWAELK